MVIKKAWNCYLQDQNGKVLIDCTMGSGAQIIGHGNRLAKKISQQVKKGTIYTVPNSYVEEVEFLLKTYINPDLNNQYIFCSTGTEANMRAIRLARAYTGKSLIGKFYGGWHGGIDGLIESEGVPDETNNLFKTLPYNEDSCFDKIPKDFAAVIIEPTQGSNPRGDVGSFLQKLQKHCKQKGVLLIVDEVMTGFRVAATGGCGIFNIKPDIVTYGKVLGGGFPIGVVGASSQIAKTKNVFYGGTFSANPLSMYAAKLILDTIVNKKYIRYPNLDFVGSLFRERLNRFFGEQEVNMQAIGCGPVNRLVFTNKYIKSKKDRDLLETQDQNSFYNKLKLNGVFINSNRIIQFSMSHTTEVIDKLVKCIVKTVQENK